MGQSSYPQSIREAVQNLIRAGSTVDDLMEHYGVSKGTVYNWLSQMRAGGEDVAFVKRADQYKGRAFERFAGGASVQDLVEETPVSRAQLYRWREEFQGGDTSDDVVDDPARGVEAPASLDVPPLPARRPGSDAQKDILISQLRAALAEKTIEASFFRGALREVEERRRQSTRSGETPSTSRFSR